MSVPHIIRVLDQAAHLEEVATSLVLDAFNQFVPLSDVFPSYVQYRIEHAEGRESHRIRMGQVKGIK